MECCRVCLTNTPDKHIDELKTSKKDGHKDYSEIFLFCLDIQITEHPEITKKLCTKCFKKILTFYKFKSMALRNDAYLKSVLPEELVTLKLEPIQEVQYIVGPISDIDSDVLTNAEVKMEAEFETNDLKQEYDHEISVNIVKRELVDSDDEILCDLEMVRQSKQICSRLQSADDNCETELSETCNTVPPLYVSKIKRKHTIHKKKKAMLEGRIKKKISHHSATEGGVCDQCGANVQNLKLHTRVHIPRHSRKRFPCQQCDKVFISSSTLSVHRKIKHLGKLGHCDICNRDYACLKKHQLLMHNKDKMKVQCELCKLRFLCQSKLDIHMTHHTKEKPYQCDHCGKNFRIKLLLQQHVRSIHEKEKNYVCQHCSKAFFKKYHFMNHLRTHTKEKPFKCSMCDKSFGTTTHLRNHQYSHRSIKEFHCKLCSMSFISPMNLRTHMLSHSSEKKFPCRYCGVGFKRSNPRKKHEYEKHEKNMIVTS